MSENPVYRFSIAELLAIVAMLAISLVWPVMAPCVAALLLIRVGVGFWQAFAIVLVGMWLVIRFFG
jgi:hypothetical protein